MSSSDAVQQIIEAEQDLSKGKPGARIRLMSAAQSLAASLETPSETIQRVGWAEPALAGCLRTAVALNLFQHLDEHHPKSPETIAGALKAETALIARMLKHLSAMNIVEEAGSNLYKSTGFTRALLEPAYKEGIVYTYDVAGPSFRLLPMYLQNTNYRVPDKLDSGPFQFAHNTTVPFWAWLGENPSYLASFNSYMGGYRRGKPFWAQEGFYPVASRLLDSENNSSGVLLVDIGGGMGHDLEAFKTFFPEIPGKMVLEDRAEVLANISSSAVGIEAKIHDFFIEQPVKGAKAYYLHSVLHDWDDDNCIKILRNIRPAMKPGFSKVLVNELIIPDKSPHWSATSMDFLMMILGGIRERTELEWRAIFEKASFKVNGIWTYEPGTESIIELE